MDADHPLRWPTLASRCTGEVKIVRPDFIFFARKADGTIVADIVDPHSLHLEDALPKLKGLARYADAHPGVFRRIEVMAKIGTGYRVIDLTEAGGRAAVSAAATVGEVYASAATHDYGT